MIQANLEWDGENAKRFVFDACWEGLAAATVYLFNLVQAALNVANPRPYENSAKPGEAPHKRTGHGAGHIEPEFDREKLSTRIGLRPGAKYMLFHELGTKAVTIVPKKAKALRFKIGGRWIICQKVNRPAQPPRPWLLATLKAHWNRIAELAASGGQP